MIGVCWRKIKIGKSYIDNHKARKNRGKPAFDKKALCRKSISVCQLCGNKCRASKLIEGICPLCYDRIKDNYNGR